MRIVYVDPDYRRGRLLDLVSEADRLPRHSLAQLCGLVCTLLLAPLGWILIAQQRKRVIRRVAVEQNLKNFFPRAHAKI